MTGEQDTDTTERLPANDRILLPFAVAFEKLRERFPDTTPGEVVMWVSHSYPFSDDVHRREDVLPAYHRAMLPDDPEERSAVAVHGTEFLTGDTASSLYKIHDLFFSPRALDAFEPNGRWLTYGQLTDRWGCSQRFIEERIQQTGNSPFEFWPHPLYQDAPLSESMFLLGQVKKVEVRFGLPVRRSLEERARRSTEVDSVLSHYGWPILAPAPQTTCSEKPVPLPRSESDKSEQGAAKHETELQTHKRECREIGKRLWTENPNSTKTTIIKHPDMDFYVKNYKGKNTISDWLREVDPRPKESRRGRPKKIPV